MFYSASQSLEVDTDVDERFSFVMKKDRMADADMEFWLDRLKWKIPQWGKDHWLIRALRRGIGVHHESMPKQCVFMATLLLRSRTRLSSLFSF